MLQVKAHELAPDQAAKAHTLSRALVATCMEIHSAAMHCDIVEDITCVLAQHMQQEQQPEECSDADVLQDDHGLRADTACPSTNPAPLLCPYAEKQNSRSLMDCDGQENPQGSAETLPLQRAALEESVAAGHSYNSSEQTTLRQQGAMDLRERPQKGRLKSKFADVAGRSAT